MGDVVTLRSLCAALALLVAAAPACADEEDTRRLGDVFRIASPAAALAVTYFKHDPRGRGELALSLGTTLLATELAKRAFNDSAWGERPNGGPYSFPSGHAAATCASAAFLQHRYDWRYALPLYATSAFTAYSRVDADRHHWRDVIGGCALAYGVSSWLVSPQLADRVGITPQVGAGGFVGLDLRVEF